MQVLEIRKAPRPWGTKRRFPNGREIMRKGKKEDTRLRAEGDGEDAPKTEWGFSLCAFYYMHEL